MFHILPCKIRLVCVKTYNDVAPYRLDSLNRRLASFELIRRSSDVFLCRFVHEELSFSILTRGLSNSCKVLFSVSYNVRQGIPLLSVIVL